MSHAAANKYEPKIELQMTPMIDIVFQLLIFFIMTFKIVVPEGDFNVKMPLDAPPALRIDQVDLPPITVRLTAGSDGGLSGLKLNGTPLRDFNHLRGEIASLVGDDRGQGSFAESAEVELDCDYDLDYEYVVRAISSVSGYVSPDNQVITMIQRIKFSPARKPLQGWS